MISIHEFVIRARVEQQSVETWIAAGWLVPPQTEPEPMKIDATQDFFVCNFGP